MTELAELLVQDAEAWHAWLDSHHADRPGVWLVLHKKGGQTTTLTYAQALWPDCWPPSDTNLHRTRARELRT